MDGVIDELSEVRVLRSEPSGESRETCSFWKGPIYGVVCGAGSHESYHYYCAAVQLTAFCKL